MHALPVPPGGQTLILTDATPIHTLYVDGSVKRGAIGGGAILHTPEGEFTNFWRFNMYSRDSNQAEILAVQHALEWVSEVAPGRPLQVYIDSYELLLHLAKKTERYQGLLELPGLFVKHQVARVQNIANNRNKKADALARKALGLH